jgi:hypothetical protein
MNKDNFSNDTFIMVTLGESVSCAAAVLVWHPDNPKNFQPSA